MGSAINKHFEIQDLIQNYRQSDRNRTIDLCEEGISNLKQFVIEWRKEHKSDPPPFLGCLEFGIPLYMEKGEYGTASSLVGRATETKAWPNEKAEESLKRIRTIERIHHDVVALLTKKSGSKGKDIYADLPEHDPEHIKWFLDHSDFVKKVKDGRFNTFYVEERSNEPDLIIEGVMNKHWEVPEHEESYCWIKGKLSIQDTFSYKNYILINFLIEETDRRNKNDFARIRFWKDNLPGEFEVSHNTGTFHLICSASSPAYQELLQRNVKVEQQIQSKPEIISGFIRSAINDVEKDALMKMYLLSAEYSAAEREFLQKLYQLREVGFYFYGGSQFKPEWRLKSNELNTQKYKEVYESVLNLFAADKGMVTDRQIHMIIQGASGWATFPEILFPTEPENPRFSSHSSWKVIADIAGKYILSYEEKIILQNKLFHYLVPEETLNAVNERWYQNTSSILEDIIGRLDLLKLAEVKKQFDSQQLDPVKMIESYLERYKFEQIKSIPQRTCIFCHSTDSNKYYHIRLIEVLRNEELPICPDCLYDAVAIAPFGPTRRPYVKTREQIVDIVRRLANETGVLPSSDPFKFLSLVPKDKLLEAITLLRQLPYESIRREIYPEGWIQILADADLLKEEIRTGIGVWCVAEDGHVCRSLSEKVIDDWLHRHDLAHELEPQYPYDAELNSTGMRADFLVGDVWVEFFGLMGRDEYAKKAETKKALAQKYDLKFIDLYSADLSEERLDKKLGCLPSK